MAASEKTEAPTKKTVLIVDDEQDIVSYLEMGASGVQLGTRLVCADECIAHENFKKAFSVCLEAKSYMVRY